MNTCYDYLIYVKKNHFKNLFNLLAKPCQAILPIPVCGILDPQPGIELIPPALAAWSLNHWTTKQPFFSIWIFILGRILWGKLLFVHEASSGSWVIDFEDALLKWLASWGQPLQGLPSFLTTCWVAANRVGVDTRQMDLQGCIRSSNDFVFYSKCNGKPWKVFSRGIKLPDYGVLLLLLF